MRKGTRVENPGGRPRVALFVVLLVVALGIPSGALGAHSVSTGPSTGVGGSAAAPNWYFRVTAHRVVYYVAHWGSDPSHTWNGTHQFGAAWELRGVGVANRYGVRLLDGGAVVRGGAVTYDDVTVVDPLGPRTPRCARAAAADKQIVEYVSQGRTPEEIGRFALARSPVRLSITSPNRLDIHPGQVPFVVHCSETEDLAAHGLTWSPGFDVPAPLRSRFRGRTTFNYYCSDDYTHKDSRHEFTGLSKFRITIAPFPLKSLKANRTALRNAIGTEPVRREFRPGDFLPDPNARDCG